MQTALDIIRLHPRGVAFLFKEHGYGSTPVTPANLEAIAKMVPGFAEQLAALIEREQYEGFNNARSGSRRIKIAGKKRRKAAASEAPAEVIRPIRIREMQGLATTPVDVIEAHTAPTIDTSKIQPAEVITTEVHGKPKKDGSKLVAAISNILGIAQKGAEVYSTIKHGTQNRQENTEVPNRSITQNDNMKNKKMLYAGLAILALLIILFIMRKKKKQDV